MRHAGPSLVSILFALAACEPPLPTETTPPPTTTGAPDEVAALPTLWVVVHPSGSEAPGLYRVDLARGGAVLSSLPVPAGIESPHSVALDPATDELVVAGFSASGPSTVAVRASDGTPTGRPLAQGYEVAVDPDGVLWFADAEGVGRDTVEGVQRREVDAPSGLTSLSFIDGELTTLVNGARDWMLSWDAERVPTGLRVLPARFQGTYAVAAFDGLLLVAENETIHALRGDEIVASVTLPVGPWVTGMAVVPR